MKTHTVLDTGVTVARAYGQYNIFQNLQDIKKGCNILIACLGRLMDFVENQHFHLRAVRWLIIDEADRFMKYDVDAALLKLLKWPQLPPVSFPYYFNSLIYRNYF